MLPRNSGLEADQKVLAAHGVFATTTTTALTAQNTLGVADVHLVPPLFVGKCIDQVMCDVGADVIKIGMLASAETIEVVSERLKKWEVVMVVLDPVMVATSGAQLLPGDAVRVLREKLLPLTTILTPNVPEAAMLLNDAGVEFEHPSKLEDMKVLARLVHGLGPKYVLLKGGHLPLSKTYKKEKDRKEVLVDVLFDGKDFGLVESAYLTSKNTHGTGCSLASAIAANLALGHSMESAVQKACRYVEAGIRTSRDMGRGSGPINHFHSMQLVPYAPGRFIDWLLSRADVRPLWTAFTQHQFVQQVGDGSLSVEVFKNYIIQDYLYLTHFARTTSLTGYKSTSMDAIAASAQNVLHIETEMKLHLEYAAEFGLSKTDIEAHKESQACVAYSRWMLDVGMSQDWMALQMALASCLLGYNVAAKWLMAWERSKKENNRYWKWAQNYVSSDYEEAVRKGSDLLENHIVKQSPSRLEELVQIFVRATEMEIAFWEFGSHKTVPWLRKPVCL